MSGANALCTPERHLEDVWKSHHQRVQNGQKSSLIIPFWRFQPVGHGAAFVSSEEFPRQTLGAVWVQPFLDSHPHERALATWLVLQWCSSMRCWWGPLGDEGRRVRVGCYLQVWVMEECSEQTLLPWQVMSDDTQWQMTFTAASFTPVWTVSPGTWK